MQNIHFKMETLHNAINLVTKTCFFGSVDLSDAYYSISIVEPDRKYFSIFFKGEKVSIWSLG